MTSVNKIEIIKAFFLAALAPAIAFYVLMTLFSIFMGFYTSLFAKEGYMNIFVLIFGNLFWFMFTIPVSYFFTLVLGVPAYFVYKKFGLISLKAYLIGSALLGILITGPLLYLLEGAGFSNYWIYPAAMSSGLLAGYVFWRIAYRNPQF